MQRLHDGTALADIRNEADEQVLIVGTCMADGAADRQESMYVSSLWCRRDTRCINVFSQDTPASGIAVV